MKKLCTLFLITFLLLSISFTVAKADSNTNIDNVFLPYENKSIYVSCETMLIYISKCMNQSIPIKAFDITLEKEIQPEFIEKIILTDDISITDFDIPIFNNFIGTIEGNTNSLTLNNCNGFIFSSEKIVIENLSLIYRSNNIAISDVKSLEINNCNFDIANLNASAFPIQNNDNASINNSIIKLKLNKNNGSISFIETNEICMENSTIDAVFTGENSSATIITESCKNLSLKNLIVKGFINCNYYGLTKNAENIEIKNLKINNLNVTAETKFLIAEKVKKAIIIDSDFNVSIPLFNSILESLVINSSTIRFKNNEFFIAKQCKKTEIINSLVFGAMTDFYSGLINSTDNLIIDSCDCYFYINGSDGNCISSIVKSASVCNSLINVSGNTDNFALIKSCENLTIKECNFYSKENINCMNIVVDVMNLIVDNTNVNNNLNYGCFYGSFILAENVKNSVEINNCDVCNLGNNASGKLINNLYGNAEIQNNSFKLSYNGDTIGGLINNIFSKSSEININNNYIFCDFNADTVGGVIGFISGSSNKINISENKIIGKIKCRITAGGVIGLTDSKNTELIISDNIIITDIIYPLSPLSVGNIMGTISHIGNATLNNNFIASAMHNNIDITAKTVCENINAFDNECDVYVSMLSHNFYNGIEKLIDIIGADTYYFTLNDKKVNTLIDANKYEVHVIKDEAHYIFPFVIEKEKIIESENATLNFDYDGSNIAEYNGYRLSCTDENNLPVLCPTKADSYNFTAYRENENHIYYCKGRLIINKAQYDESMLPYFNKENAIFDFNGKRIELSVIEPEKNGISYEIIYIGKSIDNVSYESNIAPYKAGKYSAKLYAIISNNYNYSGRKFVDELSFEILPKIITLIADNKEVKYGESCELTFSILNIGKEKYLIENINSIICKTKSNKRVFEMRPGNYDIILTHNLISYQYKFEIENGTLTILKGYCPPPSINDFSYKINGNNLVIATNSNELLFSLDEGSYLMQLNYRNLSKGTHTLSVKFAENDLYNESESIIITFEIIRTKTIDIIAFIVIMLIFISVVIIALILSKRSYDRRRGKRR